MYSQSALSTEYMLIPVGAVVSGLAVNPTTQTVEVAATVPGVAPLSGDWKAATWEVDATDAESVMYFARLLVGPVGGSMTLTAGLWEMHVRVTDNPEVVVRRASSAWIY